eukprot:1869619-Pleurochrysis_carterae.AAC.5
MGSLANPLKLIREQLKAAHYLRYYLLLKASLAIQKDGNMKGIKGICTQSSATSRTTQIGTLENENELIHFQQHKTAFCAAANIDRCSVVWLAAQY